MLTSLVSSDVSAHVCMSASLHLYISAFCISTSKCMYRCLSVCYLLHSVESTWSSPISLLYRASFLLPLINRNEVEKEESCTVIVLLPFPWGRLPCMMTKMTTVDVSCTKPENKREKAMGRWRRQGISSSSVLQWVTHASLASSSSASLSFLVVWCHFVGLTKNSRLTATMQ